MRLIGLTSKEASKYNECLDLLYDLAMNKVCTEKFISFSNIREVEEAYEFLASLTGRKVEKSNRDDRTIIEMESDIERHTNG